MRLSDYFLGQHLELRSRLSPATLAARISRAARSGFWPFATGVVGGVWDGHVRLRYRRSILEYNAKPVLSGRLRETPDGCIIELRYRAPIWAYVFFCVWYLLILVFALRLLTGGWAPGVTAEVKIEASVMLGALAAAPLIFHALGTRRSGEELAKIMDFLAVQAEPGR